MNQEKNWEAKLTETNWRRSRTRSLIQIGGLVEKAGLLDAFGIELGADLQKDEDMKQPISALYGALLEIKEMLQQDSANIDLWTLKGYRSFGKTGSNES